MSHLFEPPLGTIFVRKTEDPDGEPTWEIDHVWLEWLRLVGTRMSAGTDIGGTDNPLASLDSEGNIQNSGYAVDDTETDTDHLWTSDKINSLLVATGDVVGPASATNNAAVRFDLATGKLVQDSGVIIDDSDNVTANTYKVGANQVLGAQQAAEADADAPTNYTAHASGATTVTSNTATDLDTTAAALDTLEDEVTLLTTKVNNLLAKVRTHGIIAT